MSYSDVKVMVGVSVVIQVDRTDPTTKKDFTVLEGRILRVESGEFAIQTQAKTMIIPLSELLEIERKEGQRRTLTLRYLRRMESTEIRQHLLDRHGVPYDVVAALDEEAGMEYHNRIPHQLLGHRHEPSPSRRARSNGQITEPAESD